MRTFTAVDKGVQIAYHRFGSTDGPHIYERPGLLLTGVTKRPQADACAQPGEVE